MTQALAELSDKTGMPITQENGQRRYGPPTDYNGPPVQKGNFNQGLLASTQFEFGKHFPHERNLFLDPF